MVRFTKNITTIAVGIVMLSFMLSAQPARMSPQERTDKMTKDLSLTKEQQAKVLDILTKSQNSIKKLRDENTGDREAMRPAMQKLRQDSDEQLKKVLTKEQFEKWEKQRSEGQGRKPNDGTGRPHGDAVPDKNKVVDPSKSHKPAQVTEPAK